METNYKHDFKQLKRHVSVADVAYSLGYKIDKSAGIGKYVELYLGSIKNPDDKIIVTNKGPKESQIYFRRSGERGDVISFIKENINSFSFASGASEWEKIGNIMARLSNMPVTVENHEKIATADQEFNVNRFIVKDLNPDMPNKLLKLRGFKDFTIHAFSPFIKIIRDLKNENYSGFNIGFPYSDKNNTLKGFEIRGVNGFKSKAAGTDSSKSCWVADMSLGSDSVPKSIYIFESSFDAMAFYQANHLKLDTHTSAFVSVGGTFSENQITELQERYPSAKFVECFDNDISGRIYAGRMLSILSKGAININKTENGIEVLDSTGKQVVSENDFASYITLRIKRESNLYNIDSKVAPPQYKDWNDVILNNRREPFVTKSKYMALDDLRAKRESNNNPQIKI